MYRSIARMAGVLLLSPLAAFGFDAVDTLFPSTAGQFTAYPSDPVPPYELWTVRREAWLPLFPLSKRYARNRDATGRFESQM
jgi:hypothetical protein